jgi:hypothetical protein
VSASQSCEWSAASNATWLQVSPRTGNGSGSLTLVAAANNTSQERSAIVTVNEQPWAIRQAAAGAIPPIPPISSVGLSAHSTLIDPSDDR